MSRRGTLRVKAEGRKRKAGLGIALFLEDFYNGFLAVEI